MTLARQNHAFLGAIEDNPQPGPCADAIRADQNAGTGYWGIWHILAFRNDAAHHPRELSHLVMFNEAPINFYSRFVSGNGVKLVSGAAFRRLSQRIAHNGYTRHRPPSA